MDTVYGRRGRRAMIARVVRLAAASLVTGLYAGARPQRAIAASEIPIERRFQVADQWASRWGYAAAYPTCHGTSYSDSRGQVYGIVTFSSDIVEWRDVSWRDLGFPPADPRRRLTAATEYAGQQGFAHGFPNFNSADYGAGPVYGTYLIRHESSAEGRDVPLADLGLLTRLGTTRIHPTAYPITAWFRAAHLYANRLGFEGAMPNGHYAQYDGVWVMGVIFLRRGSGLVQWHDVPSWELGFPTSSDCNCFVDIDGTQRSLRDLDPLPPPDVSGYRGQIQWRNLASYYGVDYPSVEITMYVYDGSRLNLQRDEIDVVLTSDLDNDVAVAGYLNCRGAAPRVQINNPTASPVSMRLKAQCNGPTTILIESLGRDYLDIRSFWRILAGTQIVIRCRSLG